MKNKDELVELDLSDELILKLALEAHEKGITLNEYINQILIEQLKLNSR
jgi:predicted HicB family RNase H-like nuclease